MIDQPEFCGQLASVARDAAAYQMLRQRLQGALNLPAGHRNSDDDIVNAAAALTDQVAYPWRAKLCDALGLKPATAPTDTYMMDLVKGAIMDQGVLHAVEVELQRDGYLEAEEGDPVAATIRVMGNLRCLEYETEMHGKGVVGWDQLAADIHGVLVDLSVRPHVALSIHDGTREKALASLSELANAARDFKAKSKRPAFVDMLHTKVASLLEALHAPRHACSDVDEDFQVAIDDLCNAARCMKRKLDDVKKAMF